MARKFVKITEQDFELKIFKALFKAHAAEGDVLAMVNTPGKKFWANDHHICDLTPQTIKDLSKVNVDRENYGSIDEYTVSNPDNQYLGIHTLSNGLTYLGCWMGGDWETPIIFILYWDGKQLRGYIPKKGNPWNRTTKEAYGNDEKADLKDQKKHFPLDTDEESDTPADNIQEDWELIIADILSHFVEA